MNRPIDLCRSWLFVGGVDAAELDAAATSGADAVILEFEDFTPPAARPAARAAAAARLRAWRDAGRLAAVRINPLAGDGRDDLAAAMAGAPAVVMLPKISGPADVVALSDAVAAEERRLGLPVGSTQLAPNCESAAAVFETRQIAGASSRVVACLMASEDLAADLGAPRTRRSEEIAFHRAYFHSACVAAGVLSIDCPYTFDDAAGLAAHSADARALGYRAKAVVRAAHAATVNDAFTPDADAVAHAERIVAAGAAAAARGESRATIDGHVVEPPTLKNAEALLARAAALAAQS